ncbi:hypothetical protein K432DRAFT_271673, partial [Lepidopterella palustris CBS 459.81]
AMAAESIDIELSSSGVAMVGQIQQDLIERVKSHLNAPEITQRHHRQTELKWNRDCDAVAFDFES